jgi:hypothetical protein
MASYSNTGQFDLARKRAAQQATAEQQQQDDALKRRFAAQGGLNSGAYVKQQSLQADQAMRRKADVMEGIDVAEANEAQRQREVQEGRDFARAERLGSQEFARGERLGGQDFSAIQSDLQRKFQTGERLGAQDFANLQRIAGQEFTTGERESSQLWQGSQNDLNRALQARGLELQDKQIQNQVAQFDMDYRFRKEQFKAQNDQWLKQYNLEKDAQDFNTYLAILEHNQDPFSMKINAGGSYSIGGRKSYWDTF